MAIIIRKKGRVPEPDPVVVTPPKPVAPAKVTPGRLLDGECRLVMSMGPNGIVSWWLMAGYMYHIHDKPIISDALFDEMGKTLASTWNQITHQHKHLITPADLSAVSLYRLKPTDYPMMCRAGASHLVKDAWGLSLDIVHQK